VALIVRTEAVKVQLCAIREWDVNGGSLGKISNCSDKMTSDSELTEVKFPWFALQVRAKRELGVAEFLRGRGYEPFLPMSRARKIWSDRIRVVAAPLFPGYLFCRVNIQDRLPVLSAPGVIRIVGYDRSPMPVDESEINAIHAIVTSGLPNEPWPYLRVGDPVQIKSGPLQGLRGILLGVRGAHRIVVSVTLLQRSVSVEIDSVYVKSLSLDRPPAENAHSNGNCSQLVTCGRY
jgi:transcription antitermination factor NusG